jgi:single-strand DNA-binding protein
MTRSGVNRAILIGYLERDPERRDLGDGTTVVNFTVITPEVWQDKQSGEERLREERHRVAIFNDAIGRIAAEHLRKGAWIYLCGTIRTRQWIDSAGTQRDTSEITLPRYRGELQMLGRKDGAER